ncbi:MAG: SH3 domain-containing protein, partial [bacterium]|nr:SH3 domain-containing protein [bacterium]
VDNKYRYSEIMSIMEKYWAIYNQDPKAAYVPQLLLRMADLYLYLYEEGAIIKKELNLTDSQLTDYFNKANDLYKKIKREFPDSSAAQAIAYVIENVKVREEPSSKSKVIKKIPAGTLVKIIDRSEQKQEISNMYDYWFKVKLVSGLEGWVYGFYLRAQY